MHTEQSSISLIFLFPLVVPGKLSNQNLGGIISDFLHFNLMTRLLRNSEDELRFPCHATILSMSIDTESFFEGTVCNISRN